MLYLLLTLLVFLLIAACGKENIPPAGEKNFSLDGTAYSAPLTIQEFLDRGWQLGSEIEWSGSSRVDAQATGWRLTRGEEHISVYLAEDALLLPETTPTDCVLRSLSVYDRDVEKLSINGLDLHAADAAALRQHLGEPERVKELQGGLGECWYYTSPLTGVREISFTLLHDTGAVSQILFQFETA